MKKIRFLKVEFSEEIAPYEINAFRGAVIEKVGRQQDLFHNHVGEEGFRYSYPLIQYKADFRRAMLLCIEDGVDEIHHFFSKKDWSLNLNGRELPVKIHKLHMNQFTMQVWDKQFRYRIRRWLALNQQNAGDYLKLSTEEERKSWLEAKLVGNILSFAKGIDWTIDKQIELQITHLKEPAKVKVKNHFMMAFDAEFSTNVFLPDHIGLGKNVSIGFGMVKQIRQTKHVNE